MDNQPTSHHPQPITFEHKKRSLLRLMGGRSWEGLLELEAQNLIIVERPHGAPPIPPGGMRVLYGVGITDLGLAVVNSQN